MTKTYHIGAASFDAPSLAPALYLVATPIGNLGDVSIRALQALAGCDAIYCEDTRVTGKILERYGIRNAMKNYHEHNAGKARPEIVSALRDGKSIVLVSDAGTPMISDPGYRLVEACASEGLPVTSNSWCFCSAHWLAAFGTSNGSLHFSGISAREKITPGETA